MLKKFKALGIITLGALMGLTGCGAAQSSNLSGEDLVNKAYTQMAGLESYTIDMDMAMALESSEQGKMNMTFATVVDSIVKPKMLIKMDSNIDLTMGEQAQSIAMTQYIEQTDTGITMYQNLMDTWYKTSVDSEEVVKQMTSDPSENLKVFADNMESAEILGDETVNERTCKKVKVKVSKDAFNEVVSQLGGLDSLGINVEEAAADQEVLNSLGDLEITFWIDSENFELVKQSMDMTNMIKELLLKALSEQGVNEGDVTDFSMSLEMTYSNFNKVEEITIPEEAKNGQQL